MLALDADPVAAVAVPDPRHVALLLRTWRAISEQSDLGRLLEIVCQAAAPAVPFDGVALIGHENGKGRPHAMHFQPMLEAGARGAATDPEGSSTAAPSGLALRPQEPYGGSQLLRQIQAGRPYLCDDVLARETWLDHERKMAMGGVRSYATFPLSTRGVLVGTATFVRKRLQPFSPAEQATLEELSRPLAAALEGAINAERLGGPAQQPSLVADARRRAQGREQSEAAGMLGPGDPAGGPVGRSPAFSRLMTLVDEVAASEATVLVTGETGTGKEQVVAALHRRSPRAHKPLVSVHCGAIPESLIAAELFGHERGAFTGAGPRRKGRFEQAQGGTLFLDEVGELSPAVQVMLLRVLQERTVERLGGGEPVAVDVRVVAATNRDLQAEVQAGRFRSDLYYRLQVFPVHVAPLRERREDVAPLAEHFIVKHAGGWPVEGIAPEALAALEAHDWPGNVRELENVIQRALVRWRGGPLQLAGPLRDDTGGPVGPVDPAASTEAATATTVSGQQAVRVQERQAIEAALAASRGKVSGKDGAAVRFGVPASTLESRIRRLQIDKHRFRSLRR